MWRCTAGQRPTPSPLFTMPSTRPPGLGCGVADLATEPARKSRPPPGERMKSMTKIRTSHVYEEMTPERRPQDPCIDGRGCRFETLEHGGHEPDSMPQAIRSPMPKAAHASTCPLRCTASR